MVHGICMVDLCYWLQRNQGSSPMLCYKVIILKVLTNWIAIVVVYIALTQNYNRVEYLYTKKKYFLFPEDRIYRVPIQLFTVHIYAACI